MINTDTLKSFEPDSKTINIIKSMDEREECNQESLRMVTIQLDQNLDNLLETLLEKYEYIERELNISSELDMDDSGYYKTKLTGYDSPRAKVGKISSSLKENTITYSTDNNSFEENSGLTIQNIDMSSLEGNVIRLSDLGKEELLCGNILDNVFFNFRREHEDTIIILDFKYIEQVSKNFLKSFAKFLLETSNKVIPVNMNATISNDFSSFIKINLYSDEDLLLDEKRDKEMRKKREKGKISTDD